MLHASAADTPFLTHEWQPSWWACLCEGELFVITVRDSGALVGLAPLFILSQPASREDGQVRRLLRIIGGVDASDYLDLIAPCGREREVLDAVLDTLAQSDEWDVLDLIQRAGGLTRPMIAARRSRPRMTGNYR